MNSLQAAYDEVYVYSMGRPGFILQHVVDAFAAQTANDQTKPIKIVFALIGLYLHVEKHYSGHQVQRAHMQLANKKRVWPMMQMPANRGNMNAIDVLTAEPGPQRDQQIDTWCESVWNTFHANRELIVELFAEHQAVRTG